MRGAEDLPPTDRTFCCCRLARVHARLAATVLLPSSAIELVTSRRFRVCFCWRCLNRTAEKSEFLRSQTFLLCYTHELTLGGNAGRNGLELGELVHRYFLYPVVNLALLFVFCRLLIPGRNAQPAVRRPPTNLLRPTIPPDRFRTVQPQTSATHQKFGSCMLALDIYGNFSFPVIC